MKFRRIALVVIVLALALAVSGQQAPSPSSAITKESLLQRRVDLEHQREQAIANVNAISGAIQECEFWISQIEAAEKALKEKQKEKEQPKKDR
jgi:hypothetical protein